MKNIDPVSFLADCTFQYEIRHNLRSLIFMIFKYFENSLDNIKIHNYI